MVISDRDLLDLHARVLFTHDGDGRLDQVNEPDGPPAPRFYVGQSYEGRLLRFRRRVSPHVVAALEQLAASEPIASDLRCSQEFLERCRRILAEERAIDAEVAGPAYRFPDEQHIPSNIISSTQANAGVLADTFPWLLAELRWRQPCIAVVKGGAAVSVCFSARTSSQAAEAGVETLPDYRGYGYAAAVVAAWSVAVQRRGLLPLYSTSWDNVASQGVARRLGLSLFATDLHFT